MDDTVESEIIVLSARMVEWKDIGPCPGEIGYAPKYLTKKDAALKYTDSIMSWLEENVTKAFRVSGRGVWFIDPDDAVIFKLKFVGWYDRL